jgi:hypothetical protein
VVHAPLAAYGVEGRIPRRTDTERRNDELWVLGVRSDGSPRLREHMFPVEPTRMIEALPERLWPWVPVGLTLITIGVVVATAAWLHG